MPTEPRDSEVAAPRESARRERSAIRLARDAWRAERKEHFASAHRLREMKWSGRNINRILRQSAPADMLAEFWASFRTRYRHEAEWRLESDLTGPFDHPECWGRDRVPLVLVGHPYDLYGERAELLRVLETLGLDLIVSRTAGWYGYGTFYVRASVPGVLPPPTDAERVETDVLLDCPDLACRLRGLSIPEPA